MGYEVSFSYYEKLKDSFDYDRENLKDFKKVYGKATEDYPLDKLCQVIMQQLARRDILIVEWEIYEFVRKKVTSRLTKSDLVIKNKKFNLKNNNVEYVDEVEEDADPICNPPVCHANIPAPPTVAQQPVNIAPRPAINIAPSSKPINLAPSIQRQSEKIVKYMQFLPSKMNKPVGRFTIEKTYPVYRESLSSNGIGMMIEVADDTGSRVQVSDEHFVPAQTSLLGDEEARFSQNSRNFVDDTNLNWSGVVKDSLPAIR
jgi:hypothetical protein